MVTGTKEYAALGKKRQELVQEAELLRKEGEARRLTASLMGEIKARSEEVESELVALNRDFKQARRQAGQEAAAKLQTDKAFQAQVAEAQKMIAPMAALAQATFTLRGDGVALPAVPGPLAELLAAFSGWMKELVRVGAKEE
jgi:hypothetical protein